MIRRAPRDLYLADWVGFGVFTLVLLLLALTGPRQILGVVPLFWSGMIDGLMLAVTFGAFLRVAVRLAFAAYVFLGNSTGWR